MILIALKSSQKQLREVYDVVSYQEATQAQVDKLFTVPEVAKMLGIGRERAYNMVKSKELPSIRISPRRIRIPQQALVEWLENKDS